jgi:hypothetical protein
MFIKTLIRLVHTLKINLHIHIVFAKIHFNIIISSTTGTGIT